MLSPVSQELDSLGLPTMSTTQFASTPADTTTMNHANGRQMDLIAFASHTLVRCGSETASAHDP